MRVESKQGSRYTLMNLVTHKTEDVHVTQMVPFNFDPERTDPRLIANTDYRAWDVESIIRHRGNPDDRKTLQFLVRWKGLPAQYDSWEDWSNVRKTQPLIRYCYANNLRRLVSKRLRLPEGEG